eukprot:6293869-Amphidinium_carterae.1
MERGLQFQFKAHKHSFSQLPIDPNKIKDLALLGLQYPHFQSFEFSSVASGWTTLTVTCLGTIPDRSFLRWLQVRKSGFVFNHRHNWERSFLPTSSHCTDASLEFASLERTGVDNVGLTFVLPCCFLLGFAGQVSPFCGPIKHVFCVRSHTNCLCQSRPRPPPAQGPVPRVLLARLLCIHDSTADRQSIVLPKPARLHPRTHLLASLLPVFCSGRGQIRPESQSDALSEKCLHPAQLPNSTPRVVLLGAEVLLPLAMLVLVVGHWRGGAKRQSTELHQRFLDAT